MVYKVETDAKQLRNTKTVRLHLLLCLGLFGCAAPNIEIGSDFPVPNVRKVPVNLGIHLSSQLTNYTYSQKINKKGEWKITLGPAQRSMFAILGNHVFDESSFVQNPAIDDSIDGFIAPTIAELQFSIPKQTRTDYFEVWIRYEFKLYDKNSNLLGEWDLPAYGKANSQNYSSDSLALQAAAISACRDAMAFFSLNFGRVPLIKNWIEAGKPFRERAPATTPDGVKT